MLLRDFAAFSAHQVQLFSRHSFQRVSPACRSVRRFSDAFTALEHLVFQQLHDFMVQRHSYGWVRRSALQRVFDPTILL